VRCGKIKLDAFIIHKRLGKTPQGLPQPQKPAHVQVALRMKTRNAAVRYIFCSEDGEGAKNPAQAERARYPDELRKAPGSEVQTGELLHTT
jgi:DNA polymerase alpha subunit A